MIKAGGAPKWDRTAHAPVIAGIALPPYLTGRNAKAVWTNNADTVMTEAQVFSPRFSRAAIAAAAGVVAALAGTLLLWSYYGTAVFFEMVRAGFAACF